MSNAYYIVDNPLPLSQDFRSLKKEGLAYIQQISGNSWTNLNVSDPGVTILDQVCYALTELGYCNDFPVSDILTGSDGKLQIKDQFYLPGDILTTSPVTIADYIRSLVDTINGVDNAVVLSVSDTKEFKNGIYKVYMLLDPLVNAEEVNNICKAAFYHLNDCRNLGELFLIPQILHPCYNEVSGSITIDKKENANKILAAIQNELRNFIFPAAVPTSYKQLSKEGFEMNEIFNGPVMQNGWIPADRIGTKKDEVKSYDLINVIKSVEGVEAVSELVFTSAPGNPNKPLSSTLNQLIVIDLLKSIAQGTLTINYLKKEVQLSNSGLSLQLINSQKPELQVVLGDAGNTQADVPHGKFRDINSYYSIQNTFPEIFGIGPDSLNTGATEYEIAQSRQLKGYLTLFDQVIANQFSQLANINRLFSFKNAMTGAPANEQEYFAKMDSSEKDNPEYPVPYESFSPTYFYQALYNVSHIKPLLKDHDIFDYSDELLPEKELQHSSWKKYQHYPYNPYLRGLAEFMENESINLERRNTILNHLLARHGESPLVLDAILDGSVYSGESLKDQVIFKSLYLQNLGLLSYYRQKAYNFTGANKLSAVIPPLPDQDQNISDSDFVDFIFDSSKINRIEKLHKSDFREYSSLELKLNLLFGLRSLYRNYLANHSEELTDTERQRLALWLVQERKGFILIETALLRQYQLIEENAESGQVSESIPVLDNGIELIFPDFIAEFNDDFKKRLNFFLENSCPLHVPYKVHFVDGILLKKLIPVYVSWHNSLVEYSNGHQNTAGNVSDNLMDMMIEINSVS